VVVCLEQGADLHMAQLMPLPLTVSCFSKIQIDFTFLVPAHPGSLGQRAVKRVCVCVCVFLVETVVAGETEGLMEAYDRCVAVYQSMSHCDYSLRVAVTSWSERVKDDMQRLVADKGTRDLLLLSSNCC